MIFACLSTVYADAAPYPRPRPDRTTQLVTAKITNYNELSLKFIFPSACDYKYQVVDNETGVKLKSGRGSYNTGDAIEEFVYFDNLAEGTQKHLLLKIKLYNVKENTRFGVKIKGGESTITKTIVLERVSGDEDTIVKVLNGDVK